jgi:hypothetical protein
MSPSFDVTFSMEIGSSPVTRQNLMPVVRGLAALWVVLIGSDEEDLVSNRAEREFRKRAGIDGTGA